VSYPSHREVDVVLRDGSTVHVRPARPADEDALADYFIGLSDESRRLRFWGQVVDVGEQARNAVRIDYADRLTLLAFGAGGRIVGGAQYAGERYGRAEIAMSVADELQGQGLASLLIAHLAQAAAEHGIAFFHAHVLPENHRMIDVFRQTGFPVTVRARPGEVEVEFPTAALDATAEAYEARLRVAAANAVRGILEPRSVAVIGASRDRATIGGRILHNLLDQPFAGVVHPVNPAAAAVQGVAAYARVGDVPGEVDVAVVAVPAPLVVDVARECAAKGVRALVVISAGFAEAGEEGRERQAQLLEVCRAAGMRLIGPNCMGVVNTDPAVRLNATFIQAYPPEGRVAFMSQSGALGIAIINMANALSLGLSSFLSVGNRADISLNDLLCYWDDDPRTDVILLYLESFGNPRRFARLVRSVGRRKPVVAVKSGRGASGRRAALSHTGALLAESGRTVDALMRQVGVIRTDTLEEMFDVATLLANQPLPEGRNVGIVTNAGGLGIQCADTCEARGLAVPVLAGATVERLRSFLPPAASVENPVDMIASASGDDYRRAIEVVAADEAVDAVVVIYIPPLEADAPAVAERIVEAIESVDVPVLTCFMSARGVPAALTRPGVRVPSYAFPEQAAIALAHVADHAAWRRAPEAVVATVPDLRSDEAAALLADALGRGREWLEPDDIQRLFDCYGLRLAGQRRAADPAEAARAAAALGGRLALKAIGPVHKSEVGAVRLGLEPGEVEAAAEQIAGRVQEAGEALEGVLVQELVEGGVEMLVGVHADPDFGAVVACGAGGVNVELSRDLAVRVAPLSDADARAMVRELAAFPLLDGFRGAARRDVGALQDVILRVSLLAAEQPAVVELDCNPVMVLERGAVVVDARVRVRAPSPRPPDAGRAGG
jgi:acetyl coenzyme A synthetase (ADP forming)-like protein